MTPSTDKLFPRALRAAFGLFLFAFADYLTIRAAIGLAPWDVLTMGLSKQLTLSYGTVCVALSFLIVAVDLILRERIGLGTILDAVIVGVSIDLFNSLNLIPEPQTLFGSLALITVALFLMSYAQYIYMSAELCCGPRDSLLVAIGKRMRAVPIGAVELLILAAVVLGGWLLGGPVGLGTVWTTVGIGVSMQIVFRLLRFEPRELNHLGFGAGMKKNTPAKESL